MRAPQAGYPYLSVTSERPQENSSQSTEKTDVEGSESDALPKSNPDRDPMPNLFNPQTYDEMLMALVFMGLVWLLIGLAAHWWSHLE